MGLRHYKKLFFAKVFGIFKSMNKTAEQIKSRIIPTLKEAGVVRSSLFGSVARGESNDESDIDILVEFDKEKVPGLFGFVGLQQDLEDILGRKIDLLTYNSIHPFIRDNIMKEQVVIYEKGQ